MWSYLRVASQHPRRAILGAGCVTAAAAIAVTLTSPLASAPEPSVILPPAMEVPAPAVVPPAPVPPPPAKLAADVHASELMFVFTAGKATYMKLADLKAPEDEAHGLAIPRHGKLRLATDDYVEAAIATVARRDVPAEYAVWSDRKVKVDNTCEAKVTGFAVVSRLAGAPEYAGVDAWTPATVMDAGHAVLAARLDGCTGTFARDATLPDVIVPTRLHDAALEQAARKALIASAAARQTQREWDAQTTATGDQAGPWHAGGAITTEVLRHPKTGVTFVSAHGHVEGGCGAPHANVWGLFRVTGDALVPVQLRQLDDLETIDQLIDVDGDGELELVGRSWLGKDRLLTHANGDAIDQLSVPFHGCPC